MFPALDLSVDQGAEGVRRPKRDIKRPQVFEPEEIHVKKSGGRRGSVRNDDGEEGGDGSKAGEKGRASHVDDSSADDDEKDERIKMLAASIQQIHNTLASLRRKSSTTPSASKKGIVPSLLLTWYHRPNKEVDIFDFPPHELPISIIKMWLSVPASFIHIGIASIYLKRTKQIDMVAIWKRIGVKFFGSFFATYLTASIFPVSQTGKDFLSIDYFRNLLLTEKIHYG
ncbi:hypothetical protein HK104_005493 [Borealophlyctis nickersoniae]|nr:hypothetical protein HK104_005493 [Borealophlyctis nickersoniae]